jgi:hypothetical protein
MRKRVKEFINYNFFENSFFGQDIRYTALIVMMCLISAIIVWRIIMY